MLIDKSEVRKKMLGIREITLSATDKEEKGLRVCSQFINELLLPASVGSVGLYYPIKNEVDTLPVFEFCLRKGIECFFPRVLSKREMLLFPVKSKRELVKSMHGIYEPDVSFSRGGGHGTPEILIVPGVAFNRNNYRVGYGKGYYDRFIAEHRPLLTVGFAYEFQMVEEFKVDSWDIPMDLVLTEKGWHGDLKNIPAGGQR